MYNYRIIKKMALEAVIRKWGNSFGVVFPKEYLKDKNLKPNDRILIEVIKEADYAKAFGSLKRKMSGQEFKDLAREGWNK